MRISVSGQHVDIGKALKSHVEEALEHAVTKYFDQAIDADVVFSRESHLFTTNILVNEGTGTGIVIKSQGEANDAYPAFDQALERIEKQLRRYKRRLKNHHKGKTDAEQLEELLEGTKYVISGGEEVPEENDNPLIIAEKPATIERLSVSDAVMRMELADLPALMFINEKSGALNVVYHRKDGNVSWIDPKIDMKAESAA